MGPRRMPCDTSGLLMVSPWWSCWSGRRRSPAAADGSDDGSIPGRGLPRHGTPDLLNPTPTFSLLPGRPNPSTSARDAPAVVCGPQVPDMRDTFTEPEADRQADGGRLRYLRLARR
jgi:hypothetical protein